MRVLVACEFSGVVRNAFRARGHDAWSCDLLEADDGDPHHLCCDAVEAVYRVKPKWDLLIAHPPCTRLANSGVVWLAKRNLWNDMNKACEFFNEFLDAPVAKICVENPIMHKYAREQLSWPYTQIVQPWQFGHGETKATCLWLKNLPKLVPTKIVEGRYGKMWRMPPSENRAKLRSITYQGIADAMAEQWG